METGASGVSKYHGVSDVEATIEIKIKTMDSQTYSLRVDKQMPVPALKERIASVTGVVTEHQRLICRGKVLKDDQLLSAYHVEDGHTLHLVVREPASTSSESLPTDPAAAFGRSSNGNGQYTIAPGIVVETFTLPGQGDRALPDINRIISAVLGSIGVTNPGSGTEATHARDQSANRPSDSPQTQPEQSGVRSQTDRSRLHNAIGIPTTVSFGSIQAPVIPDAVSTLSQYLSQMRQEFVNNGSGNNSGVSSAQPESLHEGLPTPASLAGLLSTTRQMLDQQAEDCLLQLARQLENQSSMTDPVLRANAQSGALRNGSLLQNLGAYFLELGRTVSTLRLGRSASEAVVNAGPAVFISPSGPNPLMVQPLPYQAGPSLGTPLSGNFQSGSGIMNGLGTSFSIPFTGSSHSGSGLIDGLGRRIDIQIRRGSTTNQTEIAGSGQSSGPMDSSANVSGERPTHQPTADTGDGPSLSTGSGVRVLPFRTVMAAIPDLNRPPSESPGGSVGMYYPLVGRYPNVASVNMTSGNRNHVTSDNQPSRMQADANTNREQQNVEDHARNGALPPSSGAGQTEPIVSRTIDINILSSGGIQSEQTADGEIPQGILHLLRGLFPGGEFEVESVSSQGGAMGSVAEQERASSAPVDETQPTATEEGIFMSRLLHQIMPLISQRGDEQDAGGETSQERDFPASSSPVEDSGAGTSRQRDGHSPGPSPKRQKITGQLSNPGPRL